jgi:hypothetical protein
MDEGIQTDVYAAVAKVADLHRHHPAADWAMTPSGLARLDEFLAGHGAPPHQHPGADMFSWQPGGTSARSVDARQYPDYLCPTFLV